MLIGAVLAGASEKEQQVILQVAKDVGLAFQIQDDILDVTSDMETLGKLLAVMRKSQNDLCDDPWACTSPKGCRKNI